MDTNLSSSHYAGGRRLGTILTAMAVLIAGTVYSAARASTTSADPICLTTANQTMNCGWTWNGVNWVSNNGNVNAYPSNTCLNAFSTSCSYANPSTVYVPPVTAGVYVPSTTTTTSYTYVQPTTSAYNYPVATILDTETSVSDQPVYVPTNASYSLEGAGGYCNLPSGGQIWVPAGASSISMGCAS